VAQSVESLRYTPGSIPDGVTGIIHSHIPSGRPIILKSTWRLTEMGCHP